MFTHFTNEDILNSDASIASAQALIEHAQLLSFDIPALSHAAGGTEMGGETELDEAKQVDMDKKYMTNGWPRDGDDWYHSDYKNVAYLYTSDFYKNMVKEGNLK